MNRYTKANIFNGWLIGGWEAMILRRAGLTSCYALKGASKDHFSCLFLRPGV
jgi:hypothetical protein